MLVRDSVVFKASWLIGEARFGPVDADKFLNGGSRSVVLSSSKFHLPQLLPALLSICYICPSPRWDRQGQIAQQFHAPCGGFSNGDQGGGAHGETGWDIGGRRDTQCAVCVPVRHFHAGASCAVTRARARHPAEGPFSSFFLPKLYFWWRRRQVLVSGRHY